MRDKLLVAAKCSGGAGILLCAYAGEDVFLIDTKQPGNVVALPVPDLSAASVDGTESNADGLGQVEALALTGNGRRAAALYRHKVLALWDTSDSASPVLLSHRLLPKKAFALLFARLDSPSGDQDLGPGTGHQEDVVLVNDKVGDVRMYRATAEMLPKTSAFLLGHTASVGTCLDLSPDGARLATGDRDEKVRISHFPCTVVIETYLLGHERFVSSVNFVENGAKVLTGSGDQTLALWDAHTGCEVVRESLPPLEGELVAEGEQLGPENGERGRNSSKSPSTIVPCAVAVTSDSALAAVTLLGQSKLLVYALPALSLIQTLDLPSVPVGAAFMDNPEEAEGEIRRVLYVTVGAPEYLLAYRVTKDGEGGAWRLEAAEEGIGVLVSVRHFGLKMGLKASLTVDEGDEDFLGGMTKENLTVRCDWNSRQRREEHAERARRKRQDKRHRERDGAVAEEGKEGEADLPAKAKPRTGTQSGEKEGREEDTLAGQA